MKKIIFLLNITIFSLLLGGAAVFGAEQYDIVIDPVKAVGSAFLIQLALQPLLGHVNLIGSLAVLTLANLDGPNGTEENIGGITTKAYWAKKGDISTFVTAPNLATATTFAELSVIATAHTFASGKKMYGIYSTEDQGQMKYTTQGGTDGTSQSGMLEIFYPGASDEVNGFCRFIQCNQTIFWVPLPDGKVFQLGSEMFPAHVKCEFDTAKNSSGVRGTKMTITNAVELCPMRYAGALQLTAAL